MRRAALVTAFAATLFAAAPGFAFEVQSGGVPLSAAHVALLAGRMAGLGSPATQQQPGAPAGATGPALNSQQQIMAFMLGGKPKGAEPEQGLGGKTAPKGFAFKR